MGFLLSAHGAETGVYFSLVGKVPKVHQNLRFWTPFEHRPCGGRAILYYGGYFVLRSSCSLSGLNRTGSRVLGEASLSGRSRDPSPSNPGDSHRAARISSCSDTFVRVDMRWQLVGRGDSARPTVMRRVTTSGPGSSSPTGYRPYRISTTGLPKGLLQRTFPTE